MEQADLKKYFYIGLVVIIAILAYLIIRDFLISIISAAILSYLFFPIYKFLNKKLKKGLSSLITLILIIAIILVPLFFIIQSLVFQAEYLLTDENIKTITETISHFLKNNPKIEQYLPQIIEKGGSWILDNILSFVSQIPKIAFDFFMIIFLCFYFFIDGERIIKKLKEIIPFKDKDKLFKNITSTTSNIIYGLGILAIIEFIIASVGFKIAGLPLWLLLGFLTGIAAFIPVLGPAIVWIPASIILILQKFYTQAIIVIITGLIVSYLIDVFLRLKILKTKTKIHPIILLIGVLGGVSLFGLVGLIAGPLIIGILIHLLEATAEK